MDEVAKLAVSEDPLGGPPVVQLLGSSQLLLAGACSQVALPARLV